ncbi:unnamed protein product, partial [Lampetra planeri]
LGAPCFNLGHLPHPSSHQRGTTAAPRRSRGTTTMDPVTPTPTYTDLTSHQASQGRIQEAPKLTHL